LTSDQTPHGWSVTDFATSILENAQNLGFVGSFGELLLSFRQDFDALFFGNLHGFPLLSFQNSLPILWIVLCSALVSQLQLSGV
jgi:hypothetical protein